MSKTNENLKRLGAFIREKRIEKGMILMTIEELACVSWQNIWKIEAGKYNPSWDYLCSIILALGYTVVFEPIEE